MQGHQESNDQAKYDRANKHKTPDYRSAEIADSPFPSGFG
jgi:hypothetical protein